MVYLMKRNLSSNFSNLPLHPQFPPELGRGGIAQVNSHQGGSKTRFVISWLEKSGQIDPPTPSYRNTGDRNEKHENQRTASFSAPEAQHSSSPAQLTTPLTIWVADGGFLYPPTLHHRWTVSLNNILIVKTEDPMDVWRVGLEAVQTGLFDNILLRPSRACPTSYLRKIQLIAEKNRKNIFVLTEKKLPHWILRKSYVSYEKDFISTNSEPSVGSQRSVSIPHSKSRNVFP